MFDSCTYLGDLAYISVIVLTSMRTYLNEINSSNNNLRCIRGDQDQNKNKCKSQNQNRVFPDVKMRVYKRSTEQRMILQDNTTHYVATQYNTIQHNKTQHNTTQLNTRQKDTKQSKAKQSKAKQSKTKPNNTDPNKTKQSTTGQNKTIGIKSKQNKSRKDKTEENAKQNKRRHEMDLLNFFHLFCHSAPIENIFEDFFFSNQPSLIPLGFSSLS